MCNADFVFAREQFRDGECREQDGYLEGAGERIVDAYKRDLQAAVPLSRLPERLQGIWASASINDHLSEVTGRVFCARTFARARRYWLCMVRTRPRVGVVSRRVPCNHAVKTPPQ